MQVEVIGGGSLGQLFAACAAKGGAETSLYTRTLEQAEIVSSLGIQVHEPDDTGAWHIAQPRLSAQPIREFSAMRLSNLNDADGSVRWVILAVKQKHLDDSLIHTLQVGLTPQDRVLSLQNGVGHIEKLAKALPDIPIYAAVTTEGARRLSEHSVLHAGKGSTLFGQTSNQANHQPSKQQDAEKMLIEVFARAGMALKVSNEIETAIYRKLIMNAVINPLTAIWRVENGALLANESRIWMMRAVFDEIISVYQAAAIPIHADWWEELLEVCRLTAHNRSSMLEDVSRKDQTEVAWINGGVMELARRFNQEAPLNQMLRELIEGMR